LILRATLSFLLCYAAALPLWLLVKDRYARAVVGVSSRVVASVQGVELTEVRSEGERQRVTFFARGVRGALRADVGIMASSFTFNAPLTFAVMGGFWFFAPRRRSYAEAAVVLLVVHLLYVFASEGQKLSAVLIRAGFKPSNLLSVLFWEFLWGFVDNLVIRFEPFLVGVYLYFRR